MNLAACKAAIWNWASAAATASQAGTTTYWDNPDAPRPAAPSVRLKIIAGPTILGMDELAKSNAGADAYEIRGPRAMTLSVTCYGPQAQQIASDLQTSLSDPATAATLDAGNVSTTTTSPLRDFSVVLETKTEQRYQFDVEMFVAESVTINPGAIQEAVGSGAVSGNQGAQPISGTYDVTYP